MKINIAIIGSKMPVGDICEIVGEFPEAEFMPHICTSLSEVPDIVAKAQEYADVILFGGPVPFALSQHVLAKDCRTTFVPFEGGSTLYNALMKVYMTYQFLPIISFEAADEKHVHEIYEEIDRSEVPRFVQIIDDKFDRDELIRIHTKLWNEREIQVIVTGIQSIYEHFKQLNIPVYLYKVTKQTIRETIKKAILMGIEKQKHQTQLTVLQFVVDEVEGSTQSTSEEALQAISQKILEYGSRLFSCSGFSSGNVTTLYTTRGMLEKATNNYEDFTLLKDIQGDSAYTISLGIGMGETSDMATHNASNARMFARQNGSNSVFLIDQNKRLAGPLGSAQPLEYALAMVQEGNLGSLMLRRFYAWMQVNKKLQISALDIRIGMNVSDRHAARILRILQEKGFASVIGKESTTRTGRPRPIYQIDMEKLSKEKKSGGTHSYD